MTAVSPGQRRSAIGGFGAFVAQWSHVLAEAPGELLVLARNSASHGPVAASAEVCLAGTDRPWIEREPRPPSDALPGAVLTLVGHRDEVTAVRFTSDGQRVVSASADGDLRIWERRTGECLQRIAHPYREPPHLEASFDPRTPLPRPTRGVDDVVVCPDRRRAVTAGHDGRLRVWDLDAGVPVLELRGHDVEAAEWSARVRLAVIDGGRLAASTAGGSVRIWDLGSGELLRELEGWSFVAASRHGGAVLTGGPRGVVRLWDVDTGTIVHELGGAKEWVGAGALGDDGAVAATASWDGQIRVWDLATGECVRSVETSWGELRGVRISAGSERVVGFGTGRVSEWDLASGARTREVARPASPVTAFDLHADGDTIATGHVDGSVRLSALAVPDPPSPFDRLPSRANAIVIAHDGAWALVACEDGILRAWDLRGGRCIAEWPGHAGAPPAAVPVGAVGVALSADARTAVSVGFDRTLRIWDCSRGTALRVIETADRGGEAEKGVALSADGGVAVSWGGGHIQVWNVRDGRRRLRFRAATRWVSSVWASADGRRAISIGAGDGPRVWDLQDGSCLQQLPRRWGRGERMAVSPDGARASTLDGSSVLVWEVARTATFKLLGHRGAVAAASFSIDGRLLATAGIDGTVWIWRLDSGECLAVYHVAAGSAVHALSGWLPRGTLVCCSADGQVHALHVHENGGRRHGGAPGRGIDMRTMVAPDRATMRFDEGMMTTTAGTVACPACGRSARFAGSHEDGRWETSFACECGWEWAE